MALALPPAAPQGSQEAAREPQPIDNSQSLQRVNAREYYGKTSVKRGVSATEREFDAARKAGAECLAYVRTVAKRDKKESGFIGRVGRCVTWSSYAGFPELRDAVFGSLVDFLDKKKLLLVGDFDCEVNPEVRVSDISSQDTSLSGEHVREHVSEQVERLVLVCNGEMSEKDLREAVGVKNRPNFTVRYLTRALEGGYIVCTSSGKRSPTQKYRLTDKGRSLAALELVREKGGRK